MRACDKLHALARSGIDLTTRHRQHPGPALLGSTGRVSVVLTNGGTMRAAVGGDFDATTDELQ